MAFKLIAIFAFVTVASAAVLPNGQLIAEPEAPAHYNFEYQVSDPATGDEKHQEESREGDAVRGSYSLVEADGSRRVVEYTADDVNGFQAVVHKEPAGAPIAAPVVTKVVKPAVAPVHTFAPIASAPLVSRVAAVPAIRAYNPYNQYYSGFAQPYAGYVQPNAGYAHPYSPYVNRYNNLYHY